MGNQKRQWCLEEKQGPLETGLAWWTQEAALTLLRGLQSEPTSGQGHESGQEKKVCSMFPCKEQEKEELVKETVRKVGMPAKQKAADR